MLVFSAVLVSPPLFFVMAVEAAEKSRRFDASRDGFVCGTYPGRIYDELRRHRINSAKLRAENLKKRTSRSQDVGDIAVIEDDGTLVIDPFNNPLDFDQLTLHFSLNASGGYDVTLLPLAFDTDFGTDLNAGDDTNHEITFTGGFTFPFFGTTWTKVWIRSNGNVTFGGIGDHNFYEPNDFFLELPMLAAFFADLDPAVAGSVLYNQKADRFVVTWDRITEFRNTNSNTTQLALFPDGSFEFAYNGVAIQIPINHLPMIIGFNSGKRDPSSQEVDFSDLPITG